MRKYSAYGDAEEMKMEKKADGCFLDCGIYI